LFFPAKKSACVVISFYFLLTISFPLYAQSSTPLPSETIKKSIPYSPLVKWTAVGIIPTVILSYGFLAWWRHGFTKKFYFDDKEGFFGASSYSGGSDKIGHLFSTYYFSKILNEFLLSSGESKENSLLYSTLTVGIPFTFIEVLDGFMPSYGAGLWDMVFNAGGLAFNYAEQKSPLFNRMFNLSLSYWPSDQFKKEFNDHLNFSEDYSGMTYHLDFNVMQLFDFGKFNLLGHLPNISASFHTKGFRPKEVYPMLEYSLGLGIDVSSLMDRYPFWKEVFSSIKIIPMLTLYNKKYYYTTINGVRRL